MNAEAIAKGVREGWLVPEEDGWHRFVWDFERVTGLGGAARWIKRPADGTKRVRSPSGPDRT